MKARKWYYTTIKPDRANDLIIVTDMEYMSQAVYEKWIEQGNIIKWMKL